MTSNYTWGSMTTLHDFGSALRHPLDTLGGGGSHNFMVTALGSCVKWPLLWHFNRCAMLIKVALASSVI